MSNPSPPVSTLDAAQALMRDGRQPLPVGHKSKEPAPEVKVGWSTFRCTQKDLPKYFNGNDQNIGVLTGKVSGNLIDVDLDCQEAIELAPAFLPQDTTIFGRPSKPESHYLIEVDSEIRTKKFKAPDMLVELRSTGCQTVLPPSTHVSGEPITYSNYVAPKKVSARDLRQVVSELAAATLLLRNWTDGSRDELCAATVGCLIRGEWDKDRIRKFIEPISDAAGDKDKKQKLEKIERLSQADLVPGKPKLIECLGQKDAEKVLSWLRLNVVELPVSLEPNGATRLDPDVPVEYLIKNTIEVSTVSVLGGWTGVGKSTLALKEAICMAGGRPFLDDETRCARVVYFSFEDSMQTLGNRYRQIYRNELAKMKQAECSDEDIKRFEFNLDRNWTYRSLAGSEIHFLEEQRGVAVRTAWVNAIAKELPGETDILYLDTLSRLIGVDENSNSNGTAFVQACEYIREYAQCHVRLIHHVSKESSKKESKDDWGLRGASSLICGFRSACILVPISESEYKKLTNPDKPDQKDILIFNHSMANNSPRAEEKYLRRVGTDFEIFRPMRRDTEITTKDAMVQLYKWYQRNGEEPFYMNTVEYARCEIWGEGTAQKLARTYVDRGELDGWLTRDMDATGHAGVYPYKFLGDPDGPF